MVEEDIYRCGVPNELNFPFLEKLRLKSIIYLSSDEPTLKLQLNISIHHLGKALVNSSEPLTEEVVIDALHILLQSSNHPVLLMCQMGRHRSGTIVGCLRKLQKWNLTSIFEEYRRYSGSKVRMLNEQFIELFDTDLVRVPNTPPAWL
ncbi:protein-tyrosine phosphatase [Rozella allomycis CSF55]|uniref:Putative tyrosine-protein phosphatase OCA1 n=1 Tax=Rozella allomycis (strain CSF55) TaxID=988480 RepID=A0A075AQG9_ROZAC|nr:putative tyrosine-protein phosphatase DG1060 [Rozella allomycis CSF55]RKP20005.1 protein-tyrosine phosphatase [Rozella allomycis CSF55]|eukprot:EPZ30842.1 putative tyrosine-protein phosphatase DG1060 [Rozella allomycis CSF55]